MSVSIAISKKEILDEIERVHPLEYLKLYAFLKRIQTNKPAIKKSSQALEKLFTLEGCLSDVKLSSVELQKRVADIWSKKYETH